MVPFLLDVLNDSMARHAEFDQVTKLNLVVNSNSDKIMHGNVSPNLILLFWGAGNVKEGVNVRETSEGTPGKLELREVPHWKL